MAPLLVLSGPSGVGKGTIINQLKSLFPKHLVVSVSHTTRKSRPNEVEGQSYYYITSSEFLEKVKQNEFLEHAEFSGNYYGTSWAEVERWTKVENVACILEIEFKGVDQLQHGSKRTDAHYIFIRPPSFEVLKQRLMSRGTENLDSLNRRLDIARTELDRMTELSCDLCVVNDDLGRATNTIAQFITEKYGFKPINE